MNRYGVSIYWSKEDQVFIAEGREPDVARGPQKEN
jgi:hypothetical protein